MNAESRQGDAGVIPDQEDSSLKVGETDQASDGQPLIEARHVSVVFDDQVVLQDIELQITRGQTLAIIGESGCGNLTQLGSLNGHDDLVGLLPDIAHD